MLIANITLITHKALCIPFKSKSIKTDSMWNIHEATETRSSFSWDQFSCRVQPNSFPFIVLQSPSCGARINFRVTAVNPLDGPLASSVACALLFAVCSHRDNSKNFHKGKFFRGVRQRVGDFCKHLIKLFATTIKIFCLNFCLRTHLDVLSP